METWKRKVTLNINMLDKNEKLSRTIPSPIIFDLTSDDDDNQKIQKVDNAQTNNLKIPLKIETLSLVKKKEKIPCELCGRKFKTIDAHDYHFKAKHHDRSVNIERSTGGDPKFVKMKRIKEKFTCLVCNKIFKSIDALKAHSEDKNHENTLFGIPKVELPEKHVETKKKKKKERTPCEMCGRQFKLFSSMLEHFKAKHGEKLSSNNIQNPIEKLQPGIALDLNHNLEINEEIPYIPELTPKVELPTCIDIKEKPIRTIPSPIIFDLTSDDDDNQQIQKVLYPRSGPVTRQRSKMYQCATCNKICTCSVELKDHLILMHKEHLPSSVIENTQTNELKIPPKIETLSLVKEKEMVSCKLCGKKFKTIDAHDSHFKAKHHDRSVDIDITKGAPKIVKIKKIKEKFTCLVCNKIFKSRKPFEAHSVAKHHEKPLSETPKVELREKHFETKKKKEKERTPCEMCGRKFKLLSSMLEHFKAKHGENLQPNIVLDFNHNIEINEEILYIPELITNFTETYLINDNTLVCIDCDEINTSYINHKKHYQINHFHQKNSIWCPISNCDEIFLKQQIFKDHLNSKHNGAVICELCDIIFGDKEYLLEHQESHPEINCVFCGENFQHEFDLDEHQSGKVICWLSRREARNNICPICGTKFRSKIHLKYHVEQKHKQLCTKKNVTVDQEKNKAIQFVKGTSENLLDHNMTE